MHCPKCDGEFDRKDCEYCDGWGHITEGAGEWAMHIPCPDCGGDGTVRECVDCGYTEED